jgi:cutinase
MTYYNVVYPPSMGAQSPATGVADTIKHMTQQSAACPNQKFVIGGYSQGAVVMHRAAVQLNPGIKARIIATATFGDGGQQTSGATLAENLEHVG